MDLAGVLIAASGVVMTSALVVTVYGGTLPRLFRSKPSTKEEPQCPEASFAGLTVEDAQMQPAVGNLDIPLPAMRAVLGNVPIQE